MLVTFKNIPTAEIRISVLPLEKRLKLKEDLQYMDSNGRTHFIPNGFTWDGASIPKVAWLIVGTPFDPTHSIASLIHDYFYDYGSIVGVSRLFADKEYRDILKLCGVSSFKANREYRAIRCLAKNRYKKGGS